MPLVHRVFCGKIEPFAAPRLSRWILRFLTFALISWPGVRVVGAEPWKTGARFNEALQRPISIASSEVPLRQTLNNLSASQQVAILLDRRIDPSQRVEIDAANLPLREVLDRLARRCHATMCVLPDVVYIGPQPIAGNLRTLLALSERALLQTPATVRAQWKAAKPMQWQDLSTPRDILKSLAASGHVEIEGAESIPHDLWAGTSTPALPLTTRVGLVLAQFDRTLTFSSDHRAHIATAPTDVTLERRYPAGLLAQQKAERWKQLVPAARIEVVDREIRVAARVEDHELLHAANEPANSVQIPGSVEQLRVDRLVLQEVPLGQVLESLSSRLGLQFKYDAQALEAVGVGLQQPISLEIEKATIDELLTAALRPLGLAFRRSGREVEVLPPSDDQ